MLRSKGLLFSSFVILDGKAISVPRHFEPNAAEDGISHDYGTKMAKILGNATKSQIPVLRVYAVFFNLDRSSIFDIPKTLLAA